jgi:hypothetical protein
MELREYEIRTVAASKSFSVPEAGPLEVDLSYTPYRNRASRVPEPGPGQTQNALRLKSESVMISVNTPVRNVM